MNKLRCVSEEELKSAGQDLYSRKARGRLGAFLPTQPLVSLGWWKGAQLAEVAAEVPAETRQVKVKAEPWIAGIDPGRSRRVPNYHWRLYVPRCRA